MCQHNANKKHHEKVYDPNSKEFCLDRSIRPLGIYWIFLGAEIIFIDEIFAFQKKGTNCQHNACVKTSVKIVLLKMKIGVYTSSEPSGPELSGMVCGSLQTIHAEEKLAFKKIFIRKNRPFLRNLGCKTFFLCSVYPKWNLLFKNHLTTSSNNPLR